VVIGGYGISDEVPSVAGGMDGCLVNLITSDLEMIATHTFHQV
jgi:hypothetical protein